MLSANDVIEGRLTRWGRLARGRCEDLGIPERSVLGRMIEEGFGAGQVSDWSSRHLPDDVVEVDRAVAGLPKRYKRAVRVHYLTDLPTMVKAQLLHTSRRSFYLLVSAGKQGVCDRLVAIRI
jgi:DNA-directed RNA polymerase specialized sigma24 family protein